MQRTTNARTTTPTPTCGSGLARDRAALDPGHPRDATPPARRTAPPLLALGFILTLAACSPDTPDTADLAPLPPAAEVDRTRTLDQFARSCALCHADGTAGAPRVGHPEEWRERIERGEAVLLARTLEGWNQMPPLGYCMDCTTDDFRALIAFMTEGVDGRPPSGPRNAVPPEAAR
jgi:cytochrome c5